MHGSMSSFAKWIKTQEGQREALARFKAADKDNSGKLSFTEASRTGNPTS